MGPGAVLQRSLPQEQATWLRNFPKCAMKKAFLIYPHQLFEDVQHLRDSDIAILIEEPLFFSEFRFHKQKLVLHRASMKAYAEYLQKNAVPTKHIEFHTIQKTEGILDVLRSEHIGSAELYDPVDDWLISRLTSMCEQAGITLTVLDTPMFLTPPAEFKAFFTARSGPRKYFMQDFYVWQRKRLGVLVQNGKPVGGAWSFDKENRKKLPKNVAVPNTFASNQSPYVAEEKAYIESHFPDNFGSTDAFWCPVTHAEAREHLARFFNERFALFGPYEDAMTTATPSVFHSTISPLLNCGLVTPTQVLEDMHVFLTTNDVPIASVEGFVRQVIGWREYIRALYVLEGRVIRSKNYFNATTKLPRSFWDGTTGIDPVDHHIGVLKAYAYTHHIPRLMVLANVMNLCAINPDDVYAWFMEMHLDAYDWVMVPNVYSMALYADGGMLTTKPYIASSNYMLKMSDFKKGAWCEIVDALFWSFVGDHADKLEQEGRLGFIGIQYRKMDAAKKDEHRRIAEEYKQKLI